MTRTILTGAPLTGAIDNAHEEIVVLDDPGVGLRAVVCIDSTRLGPADGGVRMYPYGDLSAAIADVTRLARAMSYKWAISGEARGGGKAVIIGDPRTDKSPALLRRFGDLVESLGGRYWAGADAGITLDDLVEVHKRTQYVSTLPVDAGGSGDIGPFTAAGVVEAMKACVGRALGETCLAGRRVALQGLGSCGFNVLELLVAQHAEVVATDVEDSRMARAAEIRGVEIVSPDEIFDVTADVFSPCALGGVIDDSTASRLDVKVVAGSANNVMADESAEAVLVGRGVVYAVDFVANVGGALADAHHLGQNRDDTDLLNRKFAAIGPRVLEVLHRAEIEGCLPSVVARRMAEERLVRSNESPVAV